MADTKVGQGPGVLSIDALDLAAGFTRPELVRAAPALFDRQTVNPATGQFYVGPDGETPEGPSFFLSVSPGTVQLRAMDLAKIERRSSGEPLPSSNPHLEEATIAQRLYGEAALMQARWDWEHREPLPTAGRSSTVTEWSRKSRRNMVRLLGTVDWRPLFSGGMPGLLTLTYADGWEDVAPSGEAVKRHLRIFQLRWKRRFGSPLVGVWKMEFQARGAPHFHLLVRVPYHDAGGRPLAGHEVERWCQETWASIVEHPDPVDRLLHSIRGADLDMREGARMRDVRRVASYFVKHSLKSGGSKEYQHTVPEHWKDTGPGRFWGLWGLEPVTAGVQVPVSSFVALRRLMRRYARSRGLKVCTSGRLFGGWVVVRDGPAFAAQLSRALALVG